MNLRLLTLEGILAAILSLGSGTACLMAARHAGRALSDFYGFPEGEPSPVLPRISHWAIHASGWVPVTCFIAYAMFAILRMKNRQSPWPCWLLAFILLVTVSIVLLGVTIPYTRTTFRMGGS